MGAYYKIIVREVTDGRGITHLSSVWVLYHLSSRCSVEVNDDVEACIACPSAELFQICKPALREVLAIRVDNVFSHPVPDWNADGVQSIALHLSYITLSDPSVPVILESCICCFLSEARNAIEFGLIWATAHTAPFVFRNPWLKHKH